MEVLTAAVVRGIEKENSADKPEFLNRLDILIAPRSSLGGARPKASVVDQNGSLWIAKFPSGNDLDDVGAWEAVVYEMAKRCDLNVVDIRAQRISGRHHIFMTKRFDRLAGGKRIHFSSAMTLLEYQDGDNFQNGVSYLEFADFIVSKGAPSKVGRDLEELWRRIVFSIAVSNSDDHLRNHGFLLSDEGRQIR